MLGNLMGLDPLPPQAAIMDLRILCELPKQELCLIADAIGGLADDFLRV